jgi:ABC-type Mn2+/Zn2+ transport system ATPase subunit
LSALLRKLASEGRLVIASHHDLNTVGELFDQVLILNRRTVAFGNVGEVFTKRALDEAYGREKTSNSKHQTSEKPQDSSLIPS